MITEDNISEAANDYVTSFHKTDHLHIKQYVCRAFTQGAMLQQEEPKWIPMPPKELLPDGFYWVKLYQPNTGVKKVTMVEIKDGDRIISYHYATHYCPATPPQDQE